jgi:outer membrane protein
MKNGLIIWNVVLTLALGYLLFTKFAAKNKTGSEKTITHSIDTISANSPFRIAYFQMDSVAANFEEVKKLKKELDQRAVDNNNELDKLTKEFRDRYNYFQERIKNNQMTEEQQIAATEELRQKDELISNRRKQLEQDYNEFMMRRQNDIKSKIETFIKEYNKDKSYSYVLSDDPGLFYYQDTAYDITTDVIKGLNKLYPVSKSK